MYIIDIPRTLGEDDSIMSIISVIEHIKDGYMVSSMYGKYQTLTMEPPHVIVFANMPCPRGLMSLDRWDCYNIDSETKTLIDAYPAPWEPLDPYNRYYGEEDDYEID
eukprot:TRINITY_DN3518_c0_g1_i1.p1 TRINITY_DN3518_c0_g1~~TRINITY_DN3518_c0_g1_i1.p1  ORF type:complete len:107 (+),score=12.12 TRINITY_DN3518_c0_g1_i1:404-724(+)